MPFPYYEKCDAWEPTEEGMTTFEKKFRDLPYCKNQGAKGDQCLECSARDIYGTAPKWKWGRNNTTPPHHLG